MPLFGSLDAIAARIRAARGVQLFLDFDGTLSPIAASPAEARLPARTRELLEMLADRMRVTIVSGRSLGDIRSRVGLSSLSYAGNHGLEWVLDGTEGHVPIDNAHRARVREALTILGKVASEFPGALLEDKGYTVSLHYRMVAPEKRDDFLLAAEAAIAAERERGGILVTEGKMLIEVRPSVPWHKGAFIRMAIGSGGGTSLPIFIGDDDTDEDAFAALPDAVTVRVGELARSAAGYFVESQSGVDTFLEWLARNSDHRLV